MAQSGIGIEIVAEVRAKHVQSDSSVSVDVRGGDAAFELRLVRIV